MYRVPASRGEPWTTRNSTINDKFGWMDATRLVLLALVFALYASGCTDLPTDPNFESLMAEAELEMATDPDLTASLIEDVSSSMFANMTAAAAAEISTADDLFTQARDELTRGDHQRVLSLGDQAGFRPRRGSPVHA